MKFRRLGLLFLGLTSLLSLAQVDAACTWGFISCENPLGTNALITFNSMEYSRSKYFWNTNECVDDFDVATMSLPGPSNDCLLWRGQSLNGFTNNFTDAECTSFGASSIPGYGCACLEPTCVNEFVGNNNHMKESHFLSARDCSGTSCDSRDPLGYTSENVPLYSHNLSSTAVLGDTVRLQVYVDNNATQTYPGDANYNAYRAQNTTVELSWNNTASTAMATIASSNATPSTLTSPQITLPDLPLGMRYEVIGAWHHYNEASQPPTTYAADYFTLADTELSSTGTSAIFTIGDVASGFANLHRVYFDLRVVSDENPNTNYTLTKTADPAVTEDLHPGDSVTYTITATNTGSIDTNPFTVSDDLNNYLTYVSGDTDVTYDAGEHSVMLDFSSGIPAGGTVALDFTVTVNTNAPLNQDICNQAFSDGVAISSLEICHNVESNDDPNTNYTLTKTADPAAESNVNRGDTITYTITATNNSDIPTNPFTVTDTLDGDLTFVSSTDTNVSHTNGVVTINFPTGLTVGQSLSREFTVSVNDNAPFSERVYNQASTVGQSISTENIWHLVVEEDNPLDDLTITKSAFPAVSNTVDIADEIRYTVELHNDSDTTLGTFTITDELDPNVTFEDFVDTSASPNICDETDVTCSYDAGTHTITASFSGPVIAPTQTAYIYFTVTVDNTVTDGDQVCNQATIVETSVNSENICHTVDTGGVTPDPVFSIIKEAELPAGEPLLPSDTILYSITVTNTGTIPVPAPIVVTDTLHEDLVFLSSDDGVPPPVNGVVTLTFTEDIPTGESSTLSFMVAVASNATIGEEICNDALSGTVSSDEVCYTVSDPGFTLTKSANPAPTEILQPHDAITYNITLTNTGSEPITEAIVVNDTLNEYLVFLSGDDGVNFDNLPELTLTFSDNIPVGGSETISFMVSIATNIPDGEEVCNQAFADGIAVESTEICHTVQQEAPEPNFSLEKTATPDISTVVVPGQVITYTITAHNEGNTTLENPAILDELDRNVDFVEGSFGGGCNNVGITCVYNERRHEVEALFDAPFTPQTSTLIISFDVMVNAFTSEILPENPQICNQAVLMDGDLEIATSADGFCYTVDPNGGLEDGPFIHKTVYTTDDPAVQLLDGQTVNYGDRLTYHLGIGNGGTDDITKILVTDPLDPNVTFLRFPSDSERPTNLCDNPRVQCRYLPDTHAIQIYAENITPETPLHPGMRFIDAIIEVQVNIMATADPDMVYPNTGVTYGEIFREVCNQAYYPWPTINDLVESEEICLRVEHGGYPGDEIYIDKFAEPDTTNILYYGDTIRYGLELGNLTESTVIPKVIVTDPLDPNLTCIGVPPIPDGERPTNLCDNANVTCECITNADGTESFRVILPGALNPGFQTIAAFFDVRVNYPTIGDPEFNQVCNAAYFPFPTSNDLIWSNELCHEIVDPITLVKTADPAPNTTVDPGDIITYTIEATNNTPNTRDIFMIDPLDTYLEYAGSNDPDIIYLPDTDVDNPHSVTRTFERVASGETVITTFRVRVLDPGVAGIEVCNQADETSVISTVSPGPHPIIADEDPRPMMSGGFGDLWDTIVNGIRGFFAPIMNLFQDLTGSVFDHKTVDQLITSAFSVGEENGVMRLFAADKNDREPVPSAPKAPSNRICHLVDISGMDGTFITKTVESTIPDGSIINGTNLLYTIHFESDELMPINTTLIDILDPGVIYDASVSPIIGHPDTAGVTGSVEYIAPDTVLLHVNNLTQGEWIEFTFEVTVVAANGTEICNQVFNDDDPTNGHDPDEADWFSNTVCVTTGGGGSGGGSEVHYPVGICSDLVNGSVTCRKQYPHRSFGDEAYQAWKVCDDKASTTAHHTECTRIWAEAVGLLAFGECHPDDEAGSGTWWQWDGYQNLYTWDGDFQEECNPNIIDPPVPNCEMESTYFDVEIVKIANDTAVAKEDNASYTTTLWLTRNPGDNAIKITDIKVYDLTIPADSGWLWGHVLENYASSWTWEGHPDSPESNYFYYEEDLPLLEDFWSSTIDYEMNTALTIKDDTARVANVAFAVVEYQVEIEDESWETRQLRFTDSQGDSLVNLCEDYDWKTILGSVSSMGAQASVDIIRPYLEVRGGGNVGVTEMTELTENPFGGLNTGEASTGEIFQGNETAGLTNAGDLWDTYEGAKTVTEELLGYEWRTTLDDAGVYFYEGDVTLSSNSGTFDSSKTFVINGDLTIASNFDPEGFGAFITDNIYIAKGVRSITGIFIALADDETAGTIQSLGDETSYEQLTITGALMGDATDLLQKRKWIGNTEAQEFVLEPSIKIEYDLRLLDETPPALEFFLSEDWTQE